MYGEVTTELGVQTADKNSSGTTALSMGVFTQKSQTTQTTPVAVEESKLGIPKKACIMLNIHK